MKKLYVTELTFADDKVISSEVLVKQHGHYGWIFNDIYELLKDMYVPIDSLDYLDKDGNEVSTAITNYEELAQWIVDSGQLVDYNAQATTGTAKDTPDFTYDGDDYQFVFLVSDVLSDFLVDHVDSALDKFKANMPTGIELA